MENRRILIVDDYEMTCITVAMFFEELGYICDIAHTAKQALELAEKNKNSSDQSYPIILIDLNLPDAYGLSLVKNLRNDLFFKNSKIIIFTGNDHQALNYYYQNGVDGLLIKPSTRSKILEILNLVKPDSYQESSNKIK